MSGLQLPSNGLEDHQRPAGAHLCTQCTLDSRRGGGQSASTAPEPSSTLIQARGQGTSTELWGTRLHWNLARVPLQLSVCIKCTTMCKLWFELTWFSGNEGCTSFVHSVYNVQKKCRECTVCTEEIWLLSHVYEMNTLRSWQWLKLQLLCQMFLAKYAHIFDSTWHLRFRLFITIITAGRYSWYNLWLAYSFWSYVLSVYVNRCCDGLLDKRWWWWDVVLLRVFFLCSTVVQICAPLVPPLCAHVMMNSAVPALLSDDLECCDWTDSDSVSNTLIP